jgi:hypothetical protein
LLIDWAAEHKRQQRFAGNVDVAHARRQRLGPSTRSASETFVSGSIWYDDLSIARASGVEQTEE